MNRIALYFSLLFFSIGLQNMAFGQLSTVGKEFWIGFMDNNRILPDAPDQAVIIISANEDATGTIEYQGQVVNFSINQGQQFTHIVPSTERDLLHRVSGAIENKGIYINSNGKISVYAFNERFRSADGTVVLPIGTLGKDYLLTSHYEVLTAPVGYNGNINDESTLLVIATEDNTQVEITSKVNTLSGNAPEVPFTINLNRGQSYQIKAKADLTGSRVRVIGDNADDCKKIAVFGGNKWTSVGNCGSANDHLFQQSYPTNTWGTSFVHVALSGRSSGELVKVLASEDDTQVLVNGTIRGTIDRGDFLAIDFGINETASIKTSKPSSVTVFAKSQECNQPSAPNFENGDPFMISYSPVEQLLTNIRFNALNLPSIVSHYVNIVTNTATASNTILDGQSLGGRFAPVPGDPSLSYARINLTQGIHQLSNPEGFTAYVYGFGFLESYGFAVGAALNNLNFTTETAYDFEVEGENTACLNQEGAWTINPENPEFTYFVWDFGDGSDPVVGQNVVHTFSQEGVFEITVSAALSPNTCDEQEEISFEVEVFDLSAELKGETSVCPDVEEAIYKITDKLNVFEVDFQVEGGSIIEDYGDSVRVAWGSANPDAKLIAIPYTENGCPGDSIVLDVIINQQLLAGLPEGPLEVCFDPAATQFYSSPNVVSGREYEWVVLGGQIISGQGTNTIEVSWDQPGIIGEISYTVFSLVDDQCEGLSEEIEIDVADLFEVSVLNQVNLLCNGDQNGEIALEITGGVPPYTISWVHDAALTTETATGLSAGFYTVSVIDLIGCERLLENIEIVEPDVLSIANLAVEGTTCFGKPDGVLELIINGGAPPYSIDFNGGLSFTDNLRLDDLAQGVYNWQILDVNGCNLPVSFEIVSPAPLEVDVRLEKPACPGGSNGELLAIPSGGNGPYIFTWEQGNTGDGLVGLQRGSYQVSVLDGEGCVSIGEGRVVETSPQIRMPTGFDPVNNTPIYEGVSNCELNFQLWIYNRWGQLIYTGSAGWDGTIDGNDAPNGTYSYLVSYNYLLEEVAETQEKRGVFTLIR